VGAEEFPWGEVHGGEGKKVVLMLQGIQPDREKKKNRRRGGKEKIKVPGGVS